MDAQRSPAVVAVFNGSPDTVDMLRHALQSAGFAIASAYTWQLQGGSIDLEAFLHAHAPQVVVYDIGPPYDESWRFFLDVRHTAAMRDCGFVLTTTNVEQLRMVAGPDVRSYEVLGKPYDLGRLVQAVRDALPTSRTND